MAQDQFTEIARHYDDLMAGVPYRYWAEYIEDILARIPYRPRTVLDAACGTGSVSEILMEFGYEVTGIDISPGMIEVAKGKTGKYGDVEYLVQDMTKLDLGRQFDLVISLFDSLNYITEPDQLQAAMKRIAGHLVPGGVFIFDVNTEYALSHGFFNQANLDSRHYPKYVWSAEYDKSKRICSVTMVFEVPDGDATRQFTEVHRQYAYKLDQLELMIEKAGLELVDSYFAYTFKKPSRRSDRVFFVARKPGEES